MTRLIGISGSLRKASLNAALLKAASELMPEGSTLEIGTIRGIPLYDGDLEAADGIPDAVTVLKEQIVAADGLVLVTPEYNNSIPGVFKNAIDWLSRPSSDIARVFRGKPVLLMGASPGGFGTILSQAAWLPVLRTLGTDQYNGGRMMLSHADAALEGGVLGDEKAKAQLTKLLAGFVEHVAAVKG